MIKVVSTKAGQVHEPCVVDPSPAARILEAVSGTLKGTETPIHGPGSAFVALLLPLVGGLVSMVFALLYLILRRVVRVASGSGSRQAVPGS